MRISLPLLSQLEALSDHVLADAQLNPKMSRLNQRKMSREFSH
jgi:hypothetical protein